MSDLPERLEQLDFSKNSRKREALRIRLVSKAWEQLPKQAKGRKRNERIGLFLHLTAIAVALGALLISVNWPRTYFASTSPTSTPAFNINQIVAATFQAMTQESQPATIVAVPTETSTQMPEITPIATNVPESVTQEGPQTFVGPPTEIPAITPDIGNQAFSMPVPSTTPYEAQMPFETAQAKVSSPDGSAILPRSLYFIRSASSQSGSQIYRLEKDGKSITQITSEAGDGVTDFDFSAIQGKIAYIAGNQLFLADADGTNRQPLTNLEGRFLVSPHWTPDGQILAYQNNGKIYFYSTQTGAISPILEDSLGVKAYAPEEFSPNSQKLIVRANWIFTAGQDIMIYDVPSKTLITIQPAKPGWISPLGYVLTTWVDSNSIFGFYPTMGPTGPGLWQVNANDGAIEPIIWSSAIPPMTGVLAPRRTDNGDLVYLYTVGETVDSPLTLVRSASDGITNRETIRRESFFGFNALWSPNGEALVLLLTNYPGHSATNLEWIPIDPSLPVITLLSDASTLGEIFRWGP